MEKTTMKSNYFAACTTLDQLKSTYRTLCKSNHPDLHPNDLHSLGMALIIDGFQLLLHQLSIHLSGGNIAVPHHLLNARDQKPEKDNAFGGGAGMGVSITPISLLVIQGESVRVVSVDQPAATAAERIIDLVPGVMDKVGDLIDKKKGNDAPAAEE